MRVASLIVALACQVWMLASPVLADDVSMTVERLTGRDQTSSFVFPSVPAPIKNDAGTDGRWRSWGGPVDRNGGGLDVLHDGKLPTQSDQPRQNFFFATQPGGGRLAVDLKRIVSIQQINSYSWHPGERSDQVFQLYGSQGTADGFLLEPAADLDPTTCGYELLAMIDTRARRAGGQVAVAVGSQTKPLGDWQHLLWDVSATDKNSRFSNTFFSEIDVVEVGTEGELAVVPRPVRRKQFSFEDGKYTITLDTTDAPDLTVWTEKEALPEMTKWYPKIVAMLPSDGFEAPTSIECVFDDSYDGVAATSGDRIVCSPDWFRRQLQREAKGALVHELVHVVQQYPFWRRGSGKARAPGWVVEGIADYVRWHLYEPAEKGKGVAGRSPSRMRHDASYRETASFLAWVIDNGHPDFLSKLNAVVRNGEYSKDFWIDSTGESLEELARRWNES